MEDEMHRVMKFLLACLVVFTFIAVAESHGAWASVQWIETIDSNGESHVEIKRSPDGTSTADRSKTPRRAVEPAELMRKEFYDSIMNYIRTRKITRGTQAGQRFGAVYRRAARPKALAVCINWNQSYGLKLNMVGGTRFQFSTGTGQCRKQNPTMSIEQCVISDCQSQASCPRGTRCTVVDINDRNALKFPRDWNERTSAR